MATIMRDSEDATVWEAPQRHVPGGAPRPHSPGVDRAVYTGARLIDPATGTVREDTTIVVEAERIAAVTQSAVPRVDGVVTDLGGAYVIPGLIDSHQHLATPPNRPEAEALLRRQVYGGVTTIRDMADDLRHMADLARGTLVGEIPGPDIVYAALMAGPSFFADPRTIAVCRGAVPGQVPWMQAITDDTDLRLAVALARGTGASAIKVYADLDAATVERIVAEAHAQGLPVWSHATVFPASPTDNIDAGVDVLSHASLLPYELLSQDSPLSYHSHRGLGPAAMDRFWSGPHDALDAVLSRMAAHGTVLDATAAMSLHPEPTPSGEERAPSAADELQAEVVSWLTRRARELGVVVSAGTDFEVLDDQPFPALLTELEFLVDRCGFSTAEALDAATTGGAASLGLTDVGSVAVGALANLVVLADNPLDDVGHLRSIVMTIKRGREFARSDFTGQPTQEQG